MVWVLSKNSDGFVGLKLRPIRYATNKRVRPLNPEDKQSWIQDTITSHEGWYAQDMVVLPPSESMHVYGADVDWWICWQPVGDPMPTHKFSAERGFLGMTKDIVKKFGPSKDCPMCKGDPDMEPGAASPKVYF